MKTETNLREDIFFCAWKNAFYDQLEKLHANYMASDEGQSDPLEFLDFCIFMFQNGGDIIDTRQN